MKDKEIVYKLLSMGKTYKVISIIVGIAYLLYGFAMTKDLADKLVLPSILTYLFYTAIIIGSGIFADLIFNWMAALLRNLSKE